MKKVTIYSTQGQNGEILESNATMLAELKSELLTKSINISNVKFVIGATKQTLELDDALLPNEDYVLFLLPQKNNFGAIRKNLLETIERYIEVYGEKAKEFFENYLSMEDSELFVLVSEFEQNIDIDDEPIMSKEKYLETLKDMVTTLQELHKYNNGETYVQISKDLEEIQNKIRYSANNVSSELVNMANKFGISI